MAALEVEAVVVRLHDGAPAYLLPDGVIVTQEAWPLLPDAFRREVIARASLSCSEGVSWAPGTPVDDSAD